MSISKIAGRVFVLSLFGYLILYGYFSKVWQMGWPQWVLLGISISSLVLWGIFSLDAIRLWLKRRSTQFGLGLAITAVMALAILGALNWASTIYNKKYDVTQNKFHTLSDQTKRVAAGLKQNVTIKVWTTSIERMSSNVDMRKFLENYKNAGGGKIKVEISNPNEDRIGAEKDAVKRDNLVIVKAEGGRESRIDTFTDTKGEEQITNAIIQTVKGESRKKSVCFLAGHGEFSIDKTEADGLSSVKQRMTEASYDPKEIMLGNADKVPTDCEALLVIGPKTQASDNEIKVIQDYLAGGGKALALFGPGTPSSWKSLASAFGVDVRKDLIIDKNVRPLGVVFTKNYSQDVEITKSFSVPVVMPEVSSIQVPTANSKDGASIKTFVSSENYTYAKAGELKEIKNVAQGGNDLKGPFPIAVLITKPVTQASASGTAQTLTPVTPKPIKVKKAPEAPPTDHGRNDFSLFPQAFAQEGGGGMPHDEAHGVPPSKDGPKEQKNEMSLIVVGNSTFALNGFVTQYGNMDFFLNAVNYLMKDQEQIGIRPKEIRQASLELTQENLRQVYATILLVALAFLMGGIRAANRKSTGA